jgi:transposase
MQELSGSLYRQGLQGYNRASCRRYRLGGETLYGLAKRHEISRTLIRVWLAKHEAGVLDSDTAAADMLADYEARIAALERLVGKLALENEFLKEVSRTLAS